MARTPSAGVRDGDVRLDLRDGGDRALIGRRDDLTLLDHRGDRLGEGVARLREGGLDRLALGAGGEGGHVRIISAVRGLVDDHGVRCHNYLLLTVVYTDTVMA